MFSNANYTNNRYRPDSQGKPKKGVFNRKKIVALLVLFLFIGLGGFAISTKASSDKQTQTGQSGQTSTNQTSGVDTGNKSDKSTPDADKNSAATAATFDKKARSLDDPASIWIIANKQRPLKPLDYVPSVQTPAMALRLRAGTPEMQVSTAAIADLAKLDTASKAAGLPMMLASGYRSYQSQTAVYGNEVRNYGQAQADRQSARPGHSEHQTGLAIDLAPASGECLIAECFGELAEGKWLAANAHTYGFVIRYPQGKETVTGYLYEPWHLRYVGVELATEIKRLGNPTLEEFFGLPAAQNY